MHGGRAAYCVIGEGVLVEPAAGGGPQAATPPLVSPLRFGRLFGRARDMSPAAGKALHDKLIALGLRMSAPKNLDGQPPPDDGEADIPAGYTYLGQFIAHEITFDSTGDLLAEGKPFENLRTPQIDLDSLYGDPKGPSKRKELYESDGVHLRVGQTFATSSVSETHPNDLPRDKADPKNPRKAVIGDARNDENLPLAQTHVAFIRFHNKVVDTLVGEGHTKDGLFECARMTVIRHFQWIILHDYLPRLVDKGVLDCVLRHGLRWFKPAGEDGLFMPLEFSAAAFRIGHSMVRRTYEWNARHSTRVPGVLGRPVDITMLFEQTGRSGKLGGLPELASDWVIDWRRFYDFSPLMSGAALPKLNKSSKLNTLLNFGLNDVTAPGREEPAADKQLEQMQQAIAVRNLLRGFYLGLPTGEEAAEWMGETPLTPEQVSAGPHGELLGDPALRGKTPLWYYVLKEAELLGTGKDGKGGHRLGPVGSRIVAETLVGLIQNSRYSILDDPDWRPRFGRTTATGEALFEMIDLLKFADVISPIPIP